MRLILIVSALALSAPAFAPTVAHADEAPKAEEPAKKPRLICRTAQAPTGSRRPGKRTCLTADEWRARDQGTVDIDLSEGTPTRSQGSSTD